MNLSVHFPPEDEDMLIDMWHRELDACVRSGDTDYYENIRTFNKYLSLLAENALSGYAGGHRERVFSKDGLLDVKASTKALAKTGTLQRFLKKARQV